MNVGSDMAKLVPGRVSTEVDARLAYDTHGIIRKVFGSVSGRHVKYCIILNMGL